MAAQALAAAPSNLGMAETAVRSSFMAARSPPTAAQEILLAQESAVVVEVEVEVAPAAISPFMVAAS